MSLMSTFIRCACTSLLVSISCAVTQLSYTHSSYSPPTVTCNDATGCEIACIGNHSCWQTTFNSQSALYLSIAGEGKLALSEATIHCPSNGLCDIYGGGFEAFRRVTVYAESSAKMTITADGGEWGLSTANIYCPRSAPPPSCIIRLRSDSSPFWSPAVGGPILANSLIYIDSADDIEFQCDANVAWDQLFETPSYNQFFYHTAVSKSICAVEIGAYSTNDFFGTNTLQCTYRDKGTDYDLFANKPCVAWPTTAAPSSASDTTEPSLSPSEAPTIIPSVPPTIIPSAPPTKSPTKSPISPSVSPTIIPSVPPTKSPTKSPISPSVSPTIIPSVPPTKSPTKSPTIIPSVPPTKSPTKSPISPSKAPTIVPSVSPIESPQKSPTASPNLASKAPTIIPSVSPTKSPTNPTKTTFHPTLTPTYDPTIGPTKDPTGYPTKPTTDSTIDPTTVPTTDPAKDSTTSVNFTGTIEQDLDSDVEQEAHEANDNN
eukprot:593772_1